MTGISLPAWRSFRGLAEVSASLGSKAITPVHLHVALCSALLTSPQFLSIGGFGQRPSDRHVRPNRFSYRILKMGGGGWVWFIRPDAKLGRFVALRLLPEHLAQDHQALERFHREARAASALDHPHIASSTRSARMKASPSSPCSISRGRPGSSRTRPITIQKRKLMCCLALVLQEPVLNDRQGRQLSASIFGLNHHQEPTFVRSNVEADLALIPEASVSNSRCGVPIATTG